MKIKTYRSDSVTKALQMIRKDLGPDAVVLSTKKVKKGKFLGLVPSMTFEIQAAVEKSQETAPPQPKVERKEDPTPQTTLETPARAPKEQAVSDSMDQPGTEELAREIRDLRKVIRDSIEHSSTSSMALGQFEKIFGLDPDYPFDARRAQLISGECRALLKQGLDEQIVQSLLCQVKDHLGQAIGSRRQLKNTLNRGLLSLLPEQYDSRKISRTVSSRSIFLGPTGVGKTTTIAKLAAVMALGDRKRVKLLTLDTYRIGAVQQLQTYAEIIGVPLDVATSPEQLGALLEANENRDCILIDTAGYSPQKVSEQSELAALLKTLPDIQRHLVLSATTKTEDLRLSAKSFQIFEPDHVVFTKLDETATFGPIVNELIKGGVPLSYVTDGQKVPENLFVPSPNFIADLVVPVN